MKSLLAVSLQWIHSIISSTELATPTEAEFSSLVSTTPLLPSGAKIGCRTYGFTISNETNRLQHRTQTREGCEHTSTRIRTAGILTPNLGNVTRRHANGDEAETKFAATFRLQLWSSRAKFGLDGSRFV